MSYFAKPNFIVYDEWFDDDLEKNNLDFKNKNNLDFKNKKIKTISNIHEFFYEQSNYKVGASENYIQVDMKVNEKELITNSYLENASEKYNSVSNKKFPLSEKLTKRKIKFNITKKLIYSLSIFSFLFIFGFILFFISQSKKNDSSTLNKSFVIEKEF